uniref:Uncharacterized protein n=6 Tax=Cercopithecinae TaxID=9528 RepID=A0A8I5NLF0_PAPAN
MTQNRTTCTFGNSSAGEHLGQSPNPFARGAGPRTCVPACAPRRVRAASSALARALRGRARGYKGRRLGGFARRSAGDRAFVSSEFCGGKLLRCCLVTDFPPDSCTTSCYSRRPTPCSSSGGFRGLSEGEGSCASLQKRRVLSAMKHMLNLYLLGVVLTLLSIFVRVMESLEGLLENPSPGTSWTTRSQLANTEPTKGLPDHPSRSM